MAADNYFPVTYKEDMLENLFSIASVVWIIVAVALSLISQYFMFLQNLS